MHYDLDTVKASCAAKLSTIELLAEAARRLRELGPVNQAAKTGCDFAEQAPSWAKTAAEVGP